MAVGWMALDHGEFFVRQLARLVEHLSGHQGFAKVVQQARHPEFADQSLVQAQLPRQGHHQRAYGNGMHVGVVVGSLEARQADQGAGVAHYRTGYLVHQGAGESRGYRVAHAHFLEHRHHGVLAARANLRRTLDLLGHRYRLRRRLGQFCLRQLALDFSLDLGFGSGLGNRFGDRNIDPLSGIDPQFGNPAFAQSAEILGILQYKARAPEGVVHPRSAKFVDMHTKPQVPDGNSFQHEKDPCTGRPAIRSLTGTASQGARAWPNSAACRRPSRSCQPIHPVRAGASCMSGSRNSSTRPRPSACRR